MQIAQVDHAYTITREVLEGVEWIKKGMESLALDILVILTEFEERRKRMNAWFANIDSDTSSSTDSLLISLTQTARVQFALGFCRDITGRLTMQTRLGSPEDPII